MPLDVLMTDARFPSMQTLEAYDKTEDKLSAIINYLYMLKEQLAYNMWHIGSGQLTNSAIDDIQKPLYAKLEDAEGNITTLQTTASGIMAEVRNIEGDISLLSMTASNIAARVTSAEGDISWLEMFADTISARVSDAEGDISSLYITASSISARVASAEGDISSLMLTANGLSASISNLSGRTTTIEATINGLHLVTYSGTTFMSGDRVAVMGEQDAGFRIFSSATTFSDSFLVGGIRYDTSGTGYDTSRRMFVFTQNGNALKLYGDAGISINAGGGSYVWLYDTIIAPQDTYKPVYTWVTNRSLSYSDTFYSSVTVNQNNGTISGSGGMYTTVSSAIASGRYYYISGQSYYKYSRTEDGVAKFDTYYIQYSTPKTDVGYSFTKDGMFYSGSLRVPSSSVYGSLTVSAGSTASTTFDYAPKAIIVDDGITHNTGGFGARLLTPSRRSAYVFYASASESILASMDTQFRTLTVSFSSTSGSTSVYYYALY